MWHFTYTAKKLHPNKTHENAWFSAVLTILDTKRLQAEKTFLLERQDWENLSSYILAPILLFFFLTPKHQMVQFFWAHLKCVLIVKKPQGLESFRMVFSHGLYFANDRNNFFCSKQQRNVHPELPVVCAVASLPTVRTDISHIMNLGSYSSCKINSEELL